ncbi:MAG: HEPN domain-containing protein [Candidatus Aenigmarchaeota archaeon]|nr:HEPN domain-containing protein [Candidatus Aenigmarchaeota archaeon]MCX8179466.1 HEPN domain-containing protein [Candidatus Aenigmarchaeota archaeon]
MGFDKNSKKIAKLWIERAKEDLKVAEILLRNNCFSDSTYHSQQSAEKMCKALLILENAFVEDHKISLWFKRVFLKKIDKKDLDEIVLNLKSLEKHWIRPRYPFVGKGYMWDPLKEYTKEIAEDALDKAKFVFNKISKLLEKRGVKV